MAFCKEYNAATQDKVGTVIPVEITVFEVMPRTMLQFTADLLSTVDIKTTTVDAIHTYVVLMLLSRHGFACRHLQFHTTRAMLMRV